MGPLLVVSLQPSIYISLEFVEAPVDLFSERDLVELLEHGPKKPLADSVGFRAPHLGLGVVDIRQRQSELIRAVVVRPAILTATVRQHLFELHAVGFK